MIATFVLFRITLQSGLVSSDRKIACATNSVANFGLARRGILSHIFKQVKDLIHAD